MVSKDLIDTHGKVKWKSPSNIALVKYWGKHGRQLPNNPSISYTLSQAHTTTEVNYEVLKSPLDKIEVDFKFEGQPLGKFKNKIEGFLNRVNDLFPFLNYLKLDISSENSFPHSSGIASSASSMSALAMCLLSIQAKLEDKNVDLKQASILSRLGSGSASRSVFGPLTIWGKTEANALSSDEYAIQIPNEEIAESFKSFHDDILIVSKKEKAVSSTAGHALMDDNPYAANRYAQARTHLVEITRAIKSGDLEKFGSIVEKEALTLHALMMASSPPYILMEPNTIEVIRAIQAFRKNNNIPVYFTLDAGPNIHMLYPEGYAEAVAPLKQSLINYCEDGFILEDKSGPGPIQLI